jgi:hypothetical protein
MSDRASPATSPPGTPCRELLTAVGEALRLPAPAARADEISYHRLRSQRASVAVDAISRALRASDHAGMELAALDIRQLIAGLPASIYEHNGFES